MFLQSNDLLGDERAALMQQMVDTMPLFIGVKNQESQYLLGNARFAKAAGFSNTEEIKKCYDRELRCKGKTLAALFVNEDKRAIVQNKPLTILSYGFYADDKIHLLYGKKYPVLQQDGSSLGMAFCFQDVTHSPIINLAPLLSLAATPYRDRQLGEQFSYILSESIPEYGLTTRQMECLFYFMRGKSANDIATILKISKRTVETHIEFIKQKLSCQTKAEVIEKALSVGLLNYIPQSLLQREENEMCV
jgi:DNA-binding CsgD family transcriptional regulator